MNSANGLLGLAWLEEHGERNFGTMDGQLGVIVREFYDFESRRLKEGEGQEILERRLDLAFGFIEEIRSSLNPAYGFATPNDEKERIEGLLSKRFHARNPASIVWPFPDAAKAHFSKDSQHHDWPHDQSTLLSCAITYLQAYWGASPTLEKVFIAALSYSEANAFSRNVRTRRYGLGARFEPKSVESVITKRSLWIAFKNVAWLVAISLVAAGVATSEGLPLGLFTFLALHSLIGIHRHIRLKASLKQEEKELELIGSMFATSKAASSAQIAPSALVELLKQTTSDGAAWPDVLWQIALRAEDRCRWTLGPL